MNEALFTPASELSGLPIGEHPRHDAWSPLRRHVWVCQVLPIGEHPRHNAWSPLRRHVNVCRVCQLANIQDMMLRVHLGVVFS
jgi:hypothetical protein